MTDKMCGNCSGDHKFVDCPFVEREITKEEFNSLTERAEAYDRLIPWILHVADCYDCHKKGTDVCQWTRNQNKKEAQKALETLK